MIDLEKILQLLPSLNLEEILLWLQLLPSIKDNYEIFFKKQKKIDCNFTENSKEENSDISLRDYFDLEEKYKVMLCDALSNKKFNIIDKLINEKKIDINIKIKDCDTILHYAVWKKDLNFIKYAIENGLNVNKKDSYGRTALHIASSIKSDLEIIKFLIGKGAKKRCKRYA